MSASHCDELRGTKQSKPTYSITEVCPHDIAEIRVIESVATCETTVLVCAECGKQLEKPKTEC